MINLNDFPYVNHFDIPKTSVVEEDVFPESIEGNSELNEGMELVADFGEETVGKCYFTLEGKGCVTVFYGESVEELYSTKEQNSNDWYRMPTDVFETDGAARVYASSSRRGFRYFRILCTNGTVKLVSSRVSHTHYAIKEEKTFFSKEPLLNDIWNICKRTTLLCMQEFFEDGIKRDGILWLGDARMQALCAQTCFGDSELTRTSLLRIANSQRSNGILYANAIWSGAHGCPHNIDYMFRNVKNPKLSAEESFPAGCGKLHYVQYSVDFINMAWEYYDFSKDEKTISELFPFMKRDLDYLLALNEEEIHKKLLPSPSQAKVARDCIDQGGFLSTYYAFLVYGLENYKKICTFLGEKDEYARAVSEKNKYTAKVRKFFESGVCYDTDRSGDSMYPVSAPTMAFLSGCLDRQEYLAAMKGIEGKAALIVDGYWKYLELCAMFEAGLYDTAMEKLRLYWGTMLKYGATTCWEHLDPENLYILKDFVISRCHGWSAGAAVLLKKYVEK